MSRPVIVIGGPTAGGKTALALAVAECFDGTIINADSMQVYRDLRVLTARPDAPTLARAPHRLYGVLSATETCSAGRWRDLALAEIRDARAVGRVPILVGGTGLYLKALMQGLAPVPEIAAKNRAKAQALHRRLGGQAFHAELGRLDPAMAQRLHAGDKQRLVRAYEVIVQTGRSLADWQAGSSTQPEAGGEAYAPIVLLPPREMLYQACDRRFDRMLEDGAMAEVAALVGLPADRPIMKALGVPALMAHLGGEMSLDEAVTAAKQQTRNYAKRQTTWFRHQLPEARRYDAQYSESLTDEIFPFIRQFLLTGEG